MVAALSKRIPGWLVANLSWVAVLAVGGGLLTGFWTTLTRFPWYSLALILLGLALLILWIILNRQRLMVWLRGRMQSSPPVFPSGGPTQIAAIAYAGQIEIGSALMEQHFSSSEATTLVPATKEAVEARAQRLRDLGEGLASFLADRIANEPAMELVGKSQEEHLEHMRASRLYDQRTGRLYRSQFQAQLIAAKEDLSGMGCHDADLEHDLASSQRAIHPILLQRIADRAQVLAIKAADYAATLGEQSEQPPMQ